MSKNTIPPVRAGSVNGREDIPPSPDLLDPFNPENLRIDLDYSKSSKKLLTKVPVRKPAKQDFIRTHPSSAYRLTAALIELREERETYLVLPQFFGELEQSLRSVHTLYLTVNRQEVVSLWPVKIPGPDSRQNDWHSSAVEAAERATKDWIRVASNMSLGAYEIIEAENRLSEPKWPGLSFQEILKIAFKDRLVHGPDHPVMQRLRGAI